MTNAEAIEILNDNPVAYPDPDAQGVWDEAISMAISALEKQEGKKPYNRCGCPNCNQIVIVTQNFCDRCGQRIDWSDEE